MRLDDSIKKQRELIEKDSQEQFAALYREHVDAVYRYTLMRVGNVQDAQDLTAQTFTSAWEASKRYRGDGSFKAWIFGIARRKTADFFRAHKATLDIEGVMELEDQGMVVESSLEMKFDIEQVTAAMQKLTKDRAEAITLRIFGGLSVKETSQVMRKSQAAVKMLTHRAVQDLQELLEDER